MMECLEEMSEKGSYSDRYRGSYSDRYGNRYGSEKHKPERDEEYGRYY
jgi:hypothetical protein